jgi:hypothetical protein
MSGTIERGLLDLTVRFSSREITAGKQFAVFVLVKNPFARPLWIERVYVSLPSELLLARDDNRRREVAEQEKEKADRRSQAKAESERLRQSIEMLRQSIDQLREKLDAFVSGVALGSKTDDLKAKILTLERLLAQHSTGITNLSIEDALSVNHVRVESTSPNISIRGKDDKDLSVGSIMVLDPRTVPQSMTRERRVTLQSSLPEGVPLQPGSTAVYTVLLNVKRSFIFPPSSYFLQFSVNFSFDALQTNESVAHRSVNTLITNTVSHEITIRPSVYSLIGGAALGGVSGATARLLKAAGQFDVSALTWSGGVSNGFAIALAVILSAVSIVVVARKSEAQSFISVEDFWGGLLIGFFVGYSSTEFFADLVRVGGASHTVPGWGDIPPPLSH